MADDEVEQNGIAGEADRNGILSTRTPPQSKSGWDGKLRVNTQAVLANPEALSDPDYSDEDAPPAGEIEADEGTFLLCCRLRSPLTITDLLDGEDPNTEACAASRYIPRLITNVQKVGDRLSTWSHIIYSCPATGKIQSLATFMLAAKQHSAH